MKTTLTIKEETIRQLKTILKPGARVQCVLRHVSRSGMFRLIDFYVVRRGQLQYLSGYMEKLGIGKRRSGKQGIGVSGCGMDMGFHCVYTMGRIMFPKGFKLSKGQYGRNGDTSGFDQDGGYAFKSEWV